MCEKIYEEEVKQTSLMAKQTELLQEFVSDNRELKKAFIEFLKKLIENKRLRFTLILYFFFTAKFSCKQCKVKMVIHT